MYYTKSNHLKHLSKEDLSVLMELCTYSNNLYNFGLYQVRQYYFKEKKYLTYFSNLKICKENENYRSIQAQISTRILQKVDIAMKSFFSLAKMVKKGSYPANKLKLPRYRDKGGLYELDIPGTIVVVKGDKMKMPMSRLYRSSHPDFENLWLPFPEDLMGKTLKMVRIIPLYNGLHFKIEYIYEEPVVDLGLDKAQAIGIDTGANNLAACVTTLGTSFLIDGKRLKSRNWYWNKEHTRLLTIAQKQGLEYTKRLAQVKDETLDAIFDLPDNRFPYKTSLKSFLQEMQVEEPEKYVATVYNAHLQAAAKEAPDREALTAEEKRYNAVRPTVRALQEYMDRDPDISRLSPEERRASFRTVQDLRQEMPKLYSKLRSVGKALEKSKDNSRNQGIER